MIKSMALVAHAYTLQRPPPHTPKPLPVTTQATLTGDTLRLERVLDEKEREVQLQRGEINGLRERLRALGGLQNTNGTTSRSCTPSSPGGGGGGNLWRGGTNTIAHPHLAQNAPPSPSLLAPPWGGSGRGGTAPYPDAEGSRPVSASDAWGGDQARGGDGRAGRGVPGGLGAARVGGAASAPPGAHVAVLRGDAAGSGRGNIVDSDLVLAASGIGAARADGV